MSRSEDLVDDEDRDLENRLAASRPKADPEFRNELRWSLFGEDAAHHRTRPHMGEGSTHRRGHAQPSSVRSMILGYAASGLLLLALSAIGAAGSGPFG